MGKPMPAPSCHGPAGVPVTGAPCDRRVVMVGSPNVGKSALFGALTGTYAAVSNYPGTTVELACGRVKHAGRTALLVDTPGMYSLVPITDEERVARAVVEEGAYDLVVHVVDAKNLARMLPLTLQLIEAGLTVTLALNMMDEARDAGFSFDLPLLAKKLGIPVLATVSHSGEGVAALRDELFRAREAVPFLHVDYGLPLEQAAREIAPLLPASPLSPRALALLALQEDRDALAAVSALPTGAAERVFAAVNRAKKGLDHPAHYLLTRERQRKAEEIAGAVVRRGEGVEGNFARRLDGLLLSPWSGVPILLAVLYLLFYKFVGSFGAGFLERILSDGLFGKVINPWVDGVAERAIPWPALRELFAGEYGMVNMGVRYAVAIVLPIVGCVFLAFALVEDSGYLPRLSFLVDRLFKRIGLSGRAVIPLTLGFGCGTMAMLMTRTLETARERLIATVLLALAIPCSAQLGIILGMAATRPALLAVWAATVGLVFLAAGLLLARVMPGEAAQFFIELPPLRLPRLANVWIKTATRLQWYLTEIIPIFLLVSVFIWAGRVTGVFAVLVGAMSVPVGWIGLPSGTASAFLFGFFRRDYGAAALYDLSRSGGMTGVQSAVALVTMTLFLPCVSQLLVTAKVQGWRTALAVAGFVIPTAFLVGGALNLLLHFTGATL
jgi:ferrous iron transport protein B